MAPGKGGGSGEEITPKMPISVLCPASGQLTVEGMKIEPHNCDSTKLFKTKKGKVGIYGACRYHLTNVFINDQLIARRYHDEGRKFEKPQRSSGERSAARRS